MKSEFPDKLNDSGSDKNITENEVKEENTLENNEVSEASDEVINSEATGTDNAELPQKPDNQGISYSDDEDDMIPDEESESEEDQEIEEIEEYIEKPVKKVKKKKRNRKKINSIKFSISLVMTFLIVGDSVILSVMILAVGKDFAGINKSDAMYKFVIAEGASTKDIANQLYESGIIEVPLMFRVTSKLSKADGLYKAGEHYLRPSMAYEAIIEELQTNPFTENKKYETVTIMFPEGITLHDAAKKLEKYKVCDADDFLSAFKSSSYEYKFDKMIESSSLKFYKKEGYFFPDTYSFYVNEEPDAVCSSIMYNFNQKFNEKYYARMEELNMSLDDVITLASVIQAEVGDPKQMKLVSSVFHNRLNDPTTFPLLQSDATKNYVENVIKPYAQIVSAEMCDAYDTYVGAGLPPGAINNPGLDAIEAALYPETTDYYYFCSDNTGKYYYAKTLKEHENNYAKALAVNKQTANTEEQVEPE
jgi:UPF0755 protein